jgi:predicted nucleic acid-binding protein
MSPLVIPDASVIVPWVFKTPDEPEASRARDLLAEWLGGRIDLLVPALWVFEVGNIIPRKNPAMAGEIMDLLLGYRLPEQEMTPELCRTAIGLMKKHGVTFYDAAYHATAIINGGVFVTADEAYLKAVGDRKHAILLRRYRLADLSPGGPMPEG